MVSKLEKGKYQLEDLKKERRTIRRSFQKFCTVSLRDQQDDAIILIFTTGVSQNTVRVGRLRGPCSAKWSPEMEGETGNGVLKWKEKLAMES